MHIDRHSLPAYAMLGMLILFMGLFSVHTLTSIYQDIGRHITMGHIIWETGHIPQTNLFSYTAPDFPFVNHHWLGSVLLYLGDRVFGLPGLIIVKALLLMTAYGLALAAAWRPRLAFPAIAIGLASLFAMADRTDVRPEVLSFLFLAWFLFVLYRKPQSWMLWTLPFVQAIWVNTHIYFFMGPLMVVAWWAGEFARSGRSALGGRRHMLLVGSMVLATLCNPSGWHGAWYPITLWSNYGYSIAENKSLFFLRAYGYPMWTSLGFGAALVLTGVSFLINYRNLRRNIDSVILTLATAIFALLMIRNFPLFALVALPVTLRNVDEANWRWNPRAGAGYALVLLALLGVSIATNQVYDQVGMSGRRFGLQVPAGFQESVDFYRAAGIHGPLFNNFDVGSFLIWKLPEEKVFIDGRPEAYPADFIQQTYIAMQEDPVVWARESERYGIHSIFWNENDVTPWSRAFVARILTDQDWIVVYRSNGILILVRATSFHPSDDGTSRRS